MSLAVFSGVESYPARVAPTISTRCSVPRPMCVSPPQSPNYFTIGPTNEQFESHKPFTCDRMRILLVPGVGHQERPDNQPWERPWEEVITAGTQYFDPAFAPTYERFDYDNLFSGKINLFTDVSAAAHLGFAPLGAAMEDAAQTVSGWFRPRRGCVGWIGQNRLSKRRMAGTQAW